MITDKSQDWRREIGQGLIAAGLLLQLSVTLRSLSPDYLSPESVRRFLGVGMGAFVTVYANLASKTLSPLAGMSCNPVTEQALRRFAAWVLTVGGMGYTAAWLLAPAESAGAISVSFLGASVLVVISRLAAALTRVPRS